MKRNGKFTIGINILFKGKGTLLQVVVNHLNALLMHAIVKRVFLC